jgi:hypothetical protein
MSAELRFAGAVNSSLPLWERERWGVVQYVSAVLHVRAPFPRPYPTWGRGGLCRTANRDLDAVFGDGPGHDMLRSGSR